MPTRWGPLFLFAVTGCTAEVDVAQDALLVHELTAVDTSRSTTELDGFPALPEREIQMLAWVGPHPAENELGHGPDTRPLLIMSHGWGGLPTKFDEMATELAIDNVVVVAPRFPMTNQDAPAGSVLGIADLHNQPGDISFLLDWIESQVADDTSVLYRRFDLDQLVLLGHSMGGSTTIALTRMDEWLDPRPKATILVAASGMATALSFGEVPQDAPGPPTLLIHGLADPIVDFEDSEIHYDKFSGERALVGVVGAQHSDLIEGDDTDAQALRDVTRSLTRAFVAEFGQDEDADLDGLLESLGTDGHDVRGGF